MSRARIAAPGHTIDMSSGIDPTSDPPAYLQIADRRRDAILVGDLEPGAQLPSERELLQRSIQHPAGDRFDQVGVHRVRVFFGMPGMELFRSPKRTDISAACLERSSAGRGVGRRQEMRRPQGTEPPP
jgi:hypothetical protein